MTADVLALMSSFFGSTLRGQTFAAYRLVETRHRAKETVPWHSHERPYLTFVLSGGYEERTKTDVSTIDAHCAVAHEAGVAHADRFGANDAHLLNLEILDGAARPELFASTRRIRGRIVAETASKLVRELERCDAWSPLVIEAALLELAASVGRSAETTAHAPRWIDTVEQLIDSRFDEPLTLRELAAAAGVHPTHLARTYRHVRGLTIGDTIRARRI